jgi:hypothetical protein
MIKGLMRLSVISVIVTGIAVFSPVGVQCVQALGIGGYFTYGSGKVEFKEDWSNSDEYFEQRSKGDATYVGGGFILDTAVAKDKVFNYRLQLGFERGKFEFDSVRDEDLDIDISDNVENFELDVNQYILDNTFGFGIVRTEFFRLWLGPQIRLGFMDGDGSGTYTGEKYKYDIYGGILGIAPVIGGNFNLRNNLTFGVDLGYRYSIIVGNLDKKGGGISESGNWYGNEHNIFINFVIMYRFNDNF